MFDLEYSRIYSSVRTKWRSRSPQRSLSSTSGRALVATRPSLTVWIMWKETLIIQPFVPFHTRATHFLRYYGPKFLHPSVPALLHPPPLDLLILTPPFVHPHPLSRAPVPPFLHLRRLGSLFFFLCPPS